MFAWWLLSGLTISQYCCLLLSRANLLRKGVHDQSTSSRSHLKPVESDSYPHFSSEISLFLPSSNPSVAKSNGYSRHCCISTRRHWIQSLARTLFTLSSHSATLPILLLSHLKSHSEQSRASGDSESPLWALLSTCSSRFYPQSFHFFSTHFPSIT